MNKIESDTTQKIIGAAGISAIFATLLVIIGIAALVFSAMIYALIITLHNEFPVLSTIWGVLFVLFFIGIILFDPTSD